MIMFSSYILSVSLVLNIFNTKARHILLLCPLVKNPSNSNVAGGKWKGTQHVYTVSAKSRFNSFDVATFHAKKCTE